MLTAVEAVEELHVDGACLCDLLSTNGVLAEGLIGLFRVLSRSASRQQRGREGNRWKDNGAELRRVTERDSYLFG